MSPGTAAALLPLSLPPFIVSTREPRALDRPPDGGKDTVAFALSPERLLQLHRKLGPSQGGSANLTAAVAWPPTQGWEVYAFVTERVKKGPFAVLFCPVSL